MKLSNIILIIGIVILAVGAALSVAKIEPYADYVLIAGAIVVIIRGFIRNHERNDRQE
jgi:hypothetical protein